MLGSRSLDPDASPHPTVIIGSKEGFRECARRDQLALLPSRRHHSVVSGIRGR